MKQVVIIFAAILFVNVSTAQTTTDWKTKVVGKWKYEGVEEFGVVTPADSTHRKDRLQINSDGTYSITEKGKESSGTYTIDVTSKTMTFKNTSGKTKLYFLKKSDPGILIIETQTPDLVRTRHRYLPE